MKNLKVKYCLVIIFTLILILSNTRLILFGKLLFDSISLPQFSGTNFYLIIDYIGIFVIFILSMFALFFFWNSNLFNHRIKIEIAVYTFIFSLILFSPLFIGSELSLSREIIFVSKIPPMTDLNYFRLKDKASEDFNYYEELFGQFGNDRRIYFQNFTDSVLITYTINGNTENIAREQILMKNNKPIINSKIFLLGTDEYGKDLFIEIIYGIRKSIIIAFIASLISFLIGSSLGYLSAISENFFGNMINRISEAFFSIPSIMLFIIILMLWKNSVLTIPVVMGLTGWITIFKVVRNEMILLKQKPFFQMSYKLGLSKLRLLRLEILPFISAQLFITIVFMFANFIIVESSLSFLGLGNEDTYSSLGNLIQRGNYYLPQYYWMTLFPVLALSFIIVSLNSIKSYIRKAIDPRLK